MPSSFFFFFFSLVDCTAPPPLSRLTGSASCDELDDELRRSTEELREREPLFDSLLANRFFSPSEKELVRERERVGSPMSVMSRFLSCHTQRARARTDHSRSNNPYGRPMLSPASAAIQQAQQAEEAGRYRRAIRYYYAALHCYQEEVASIASDYGKCGLTSQAMLIIAHIGRLRECLALSPDAEPSDDDDQEDVPVTTTTTTTTAARQVATGALLPVSVQPEPQLQQQSGATSEYEAMKQEILALCLTQAQLGDIHWDDVIGMETVKTFIDLTVQMPLEMPHIYGGNRVAPTSLLMYGPPGVGKTYIMKALARRCNHTFLPVKCASVISKYVGDSPKYVRAMFEVAKACKPCILVLDELDALLPCRDSGSGGGGGGADGSKTISQFLQEMEGITADDMTGVLLIGATNLPWNIDPAARRRLNRKIYIRLPDIDDRYQLIAHRLHQNSGDIGHRITETEMRLLAEATPNYSGSDLVTLIHAAYQKTIEEIKTASHFRAHKDATMGLPVLVPCRDVDELGAHAITYAQFSAEQRRMIRPRAVTYDCLVATMAQIKPAVDLDTLRKYEAWTAQYGEES